MNRYTKYVLKKFGWYFLTLIIAILLNFLLPRLIHGNPVDAMISHLAKGIKNTDTLKRIYEEYYRQFGLDKPLWQQFFIYVGNLLHGDFGVSFGLFPRTVNNILASAIPWTLALQLPAILCGWAIGNVLGAFAAYKKGIFDKIIFPVALFVSSLPFFILSIVLLYVFAVKLDWFPIGGGYNVQLNPAFTPEFIFSVIQHHMLPFLSITLVTIGGQGIGMREMALYELNSDYVNFAKLMGIRERKIIGYVFRNSMLPQITGLALSLGTMIAGALITEIVFNYPGIGTWLFSAIRRLDYPLISGCTLVITIAVLLANFLIDLLYGVIDPRIKAAQMEEE